MTSPAFRAIIGRFRAFVVRVEVKPELLRWALERSMIERDTLAGRFPKLEAWERGEVQPTLKQLEDFVAAGASSRQWAASTEAVLPRTERLRFRGGDDDH